MERIPCQSLIEPRVPTLVRRIAEWHRHGEGWKEKSSDPCYCAHDAAHSPSQSRRDEDHALHATLVTQNARCGHETANRVPQREHGQGLLPQLPPRREMIVD